MHWNALGSREEEGVRAEELAFLLVLTIVELLDDVEVELLDDFAVGKVR